MVDYTTPITTTFELQRQTLAQSQHAIESGLKFQKEMAGAAINTLEVHETTQRQVVEAFQDNVHRTVDAMEGVPGMAAVVDDVRANVDQQYEEFLTAHEEAFDAMESELGESLDSYDELTAEYLDTLEEQLDTLLEAHEEFEHQSVEATEHVGEQVEELQDQVEEVQAQIQNVSEQAAEALEA